MSAYSAVASKEGQAFWAKSLCPWMLALGNCFFSSLRRVESAVFCAAVRVSFGLLP